MGGNVLNILLNILLIYGQGPRPEVFAWAAPVALAVHAPRLGVRGAAWATLIGRTAPVLVGAVLVFIGMGFGAAASAFVGANLGADDPDRARRAGWVAAWSNVLLMIGLTAVYIRWAGPIVGFFDSSPAVLEVGREYLRTVGWTYALVGLGLVLSQAMTGAGATLSSMVIDTSILLVFVIPGAYLVTETFGLPRSAPFRVIAAGNAVAALAYVACYMRGSFLHKHV